MTERKNLLVLESLILPYERGNFGEVVNEQEGLFYLPFAIYQKFEENLGGRTNIRDVEGLATCISCCPFGFKEIQKKLGWTDEEFKRAEDKLVDTLRKYVPEEFLNPEPQPPRTYGAMPGNPTDIGKTVQQLKNKKKN